MSTQRFTPEFKEEAVKQVKRPAIPILVESGARGG